MPSSIIPIGFCQCGCGERTKIATRNHSLYGWRTGQPLRYIAGHQARKPKRVGLPVVIDGMAYMSIPLTHGREAIVDCADYERLAKHRWQACRTTGASTFYAMRMSEGPQRATVYMHREVLGVPDGIPVDHHNRNGLDNRRINLRECEHSENTRNSKRRDDNTSGYKGVSWRRDANKWCARIGHENKRIFLGVFGTPEAAALAYDDAAKKYHGEFAVLNFPDRKQKTTHEP